MKRFFFFISPIFLTCATPLFSADAENPAVVGTAAEAGADTTTTPSLTRYILPAVVVAAAVTAIVLLSTDKK